MICANVSEKDRELAAAEEENKVSQNLKNFSRRRDKGLGEGLWENMWSREEIIDILQLQKRKKVDKKRSPQKYNLNTTKIEQFVPCSTAEKLATN